MNDDIVGRVRRLQSSMAESVGPCFSEAELDELRILVRLTVEFHAFLRSNDTNPLEPRYTCESVFAAVEPFMSVTRSYKTLVGATDSKIERSTISLSSLKDQFLPMFDEFERETNFENRCRLLLDLFKLQIVFAGMSYD